MEAQVSKSVETAPIQPYSVFIEHESIGMMMMSGTRYSTRDFQLVDHHVCQGTVLAQEGKKVQIAYDDGEREWLSEKTRRQGGGAHCLVQVCQWVRTCTGIIS